MRVFRPMTTGDADALAVLHREVFDGYMGVALGRRYLRSFFAWFAQAPSAASVLCEDDGRLVGYVFGAPHGYNSSVTRDMLPEIARAVLTHVPAVVRHPNFRLQLKNRARALLGAAQPNDPYGPDTFDLVGIGTAPVARRSGVGKELLARFEDEVFRRGFPRIALSVYATNGSARTMYERSGWRLGLDEGRVLTLEKTRGPA